MKKISMNLEVEQNSNGVFYEIKVGDKTIAQIQGERADGSEAFQFDGKLIPSKSNMTYYTALSNVAAVLDGLLLEMYNDQEK